MDQIKFGAFMKELRKEKGITQEQFAQQLNVSNRTVSRWETGSNMPDISLLQEIAAFYEVSIPELIDGERKKEEMNAQEKEVINKMSEYAGTEKTAILKGIKNESLIGVCALVILLILDISGIRYSSNITEMVYLYCRTLVYVSIIMVFLHASGMLYAFKHHDRESRIPKPFLFLITIIISVIIAILFKFLL